MMNFASYHKEVKIIFLDNVYRYDPVAETKVATPRTETLNDVQLVVSGDSLICNGLPTRDEKNNLKHVTTRVFPLSEIHSYETVTKYNPEAGLGNGKELIND
jgi:hypothetical protein